LKVTFKNLGMCKRLENHFQISNYIEDSSRAETVLTSATDNGNDSWQTFFIVQNMLSINQKSQKLKITKKKYSSEIGLNFFSKQLKNLKNCKI
jgi:hypothetical protein